MERFTEAPIFSKLSLGAEAAAFLFGIIGIPTPYWQSLAGISYGLFQVCVLGVCVTLTEKTNGQIIAAAFSLIGFFSGIACLGIILLVTILQVITKPTSITRTATTALAFFAGNCILAACITYGALANNGVLGPVPFGWSFGLTIVAAIFHEVAGVLLILDKRTAMNR